MSLIELGPDKAYYKVRNHLEENLGVFDFSLIDAEMARVNEFSPGLESRISVLPNRRFGESVDR